MHKPVFWAAGLCAVGTWFGFANPVLHLPGLALILPCVLTWLGLRATTLKQAFIHGWLTAALTYAACLYWVTIPVHYFGYLPWIAAIPCPILLGLYLGLYAGIFSLVLAWARPRLPWPGLVLTAWAVWTCLEILRGSLFTGFPWLSLAQAFSPWPLALQGAGVLGAHGLSGLYAALAVSAVLGCERRPAWVITVSGLALILGFGQWQLHTPRATSPSQQKIALIQGNIDQSRKWDPAYQQQTVNRYLRLSRQTLETDRVDLLIWPETALPFYFQEDSEFTQQVTSFCRQHQVAVLTGSPGYSLNRQGRVAYHNQAYLIAPSGKVSSTYGKQHLVPFGEYIPFGRYLPFVQQLVVGAGNFRPGKHSTPMRYADLAMGILICYEIIFSDLAQERVQDGANILVNLSNDAWFGRSSGAWQHLNQAVLRAVEQGRYVLRSTNTGVSAVIDPRGRIRQHSQLFTEQTLTLDQVYARTTQTFFSAHYLAVYALFSLMLAICLAFTAFRRPCLYSPAESMRMR